MKFSGDIRVKTDMRYKSIYNDLKNRAFGDMHELFFICACLGYREKEKKPFASRGEDSFWSRTITQEEYACYYAMILNDNEMELTAIKDDKNVIAQIEKYANTGMGILIEKCLNDFIISKAPEFKLDPTSLNSCPKHLLDFLYREIY